MDLRLRVHWTYDTPGADTGGMLSRLTRSLLPFSRSSSIASHDRRRRSASDAALVSRHGQDLLVGLRHQA